MTPQTQPLATAAMYLTRKHEARAMGAPCAAVCVLAVARLASFALVMQRRHVVENLMHKLHNKMTAAERGCVLMVKRWQMAGLSNSITLNPHFNAGSGDEEDEESGVAGEGAGGLVPRGQCGAKQAPQKHVDETAGKGVEAVIAEHGPFAGAAEAVKQRMLQGGGSGHEGDAEEGHEVAHEAALGSAM